MSCSTEEAEINEVTGSIIFDYSDETSTPDVRLAFFIETVNSVQRSESFTAENESTKWIWTVSSPEMIQMNERQYVYSADLRSPQGENIPKGKYQIVYYDAAGNSAESSFEIDYDDRLLESGTEKIAELLLEHSESFAIYDDQNELIYFGKKKASWNSNNAILREYKIGDTIRKCWVTPSNKIICFFPAESLKKESKTEDDED